MTMDFKKLKNYLENKMRMSHIYQPIMIKTLLESNNKATVDKIARKFNAKDESNIEIFRITTKKMPGRILKKNNVVDEKDGSYELKIDSITDIQRRKLIEICDEKIKEYEEKRGLKAIWDYKTNSSRLISG